ncbi:MAG: hypothetical protein NC181_04935 [Clostridium sp.]|nr:hypothetical protein [Clostridium sp.]MCM1444645.1 hypothetical protein [Candidatus Amulumruptor caecigallinarius]
MINIKNEAVSALSKVLLNYKIVSKSNINSIHEVDSMVDSSPTIQTMWPTFNSKKHTLSYLQDKIEMDGKEYLYDNSLKYFTSKSLHKIDQNDYYIIEHHILTLDYSNIPIVSITTQTKFKSFPTDKIFSSLNKAISNLSLCVYEEDTNIYLGNRRILHSLGVKNIEDINFSTVEIDTIEYFDYLKDLDNIFIKLIFCNNDPIYYKYYNDIIYPSDYYSLICLKKQTEVAEREINYYIKHKFGEEIKKFIESDNHKIFSLKN